MTELESRKRVVRTFVDAINAQDCNALAAVVAPSFTIASVSNPKSADMTKGRAGLALAVAGILITGCSSDEQDTHYISLTAAQMAGAVHQGWIPEWLPKNAHNLKEKHDLDTNRSILRFNFPESDKWVPSSSCLRIHPSEVRGPGMTAPWWPKDVPSPNAATPRHTYYACSGASEFLAVDFPRGEALYWRP
jgi:hypothetical protein